MKRPLTLAAIGVVSVVTIIAACSDGVVTPKPGDATLASKTPAIAAPAMTHEHSDDPSVKNATMDPGLLRKLRRITAAYHDINAARNAGYSTQLTGCMVDPTLGGMGFHFGKGEFIDGKAEKFRPEVLLYEPQQDGSMRFVALEYIVPFDQWTKPNPPKLFGQVFKRNEAFGVWALHAWIWEHNPSGIFADWNPNVNCRFAAQ
jgi:hypothetical protein